MKIGIVGSEAAKFTLETERKARALIRSLITPEDTVISGGCHLGGIDIWAEQEARVVGIPEDRIIVYAPTRHTWSGVGGYMDRNLKIARFSDRVICITVRVLPPNYVGMRFALCYHCGTSDHVKSGGCWTTKKARQLGKGGETLVIV